MRKVLWRRLMKLRDQQPKPTTELGVGMAWGLEMMLLQADIAEYLLSRSPSGE